MKILVTGAAGFIGFHLIKKLVGEKYEVVGYDSINDYYDINLKYARLEELGIEKSSIEPNEIISSNFWPNLKFVCSQLEDGPFLASLFQENRFSMVCNLAAQAGVRYSIEQPIKYVNSNVVGFVNLLEACRSSGVQHLVYASSSSVYGLNEEIPFKTSHHTDHPVSIYAATKKSNELMAHVYSHLYNLPTTGLRFFTVYGPWGRPDMAYFSFSENILRGKPIKIFNGGKMLRDFTYIDDIVQGIYRVLVKPARSSTQFDGKNPDPSISSAPYRIYNIGNNNPVNLLSFIEILEKELGVEGRKEFVEMQAGDVTATYADVNDLYVDFAYKPSTPIEEGVKKFVSWYKAYYSIVL